MPEKMPGNRRRIYEGRIVALEVATVSMPDGSLLEMECVRHPGGAAVVAVDETGRVCLLRQYRPVLDAWCWELPAGKIDHDEPPLNTARRELAEEAAVEAAVWHELGGIVSSPGVFDERIHLYLATKLKAVTVPQEKGEFFERHWLPFVDVLAWTLDGRLADAKSIAALHRAAHHEALPPLARGKLAREKMAGEDQAR